MAEENRVSELKRLIKETEEKIKQKRLMMDQIIKKLEQKKEEVRLAQEKVAKLAPPKILTKKEIEELKKLEAQELLEKIAEERLHIDSETKKSLKHAEKMREDAMHDSEEEQELTDVSALKIEVTALKKAVKVLTDFLNEKENSAEDMLAQTAIEESVITQYKKEINALHLTKSDDKELLLAELKEAMALSRKNKSHTHSLYLKLKKGAGSIASKLYGYELKLAECLKRLEAYSDV